MPERGRALVSVGGLPSNGGGAAGFAPSPSEVAAAVGADSLLSLGSLGRAPPSAMALSGAAGSALRVGSIGDDQLVSPGALLRPSPSSTLPQGGPQDLLRRPRSADEVFTFEEGASPGQSIG